MTRIVNRPSSDLTRHLSNILTLAEDKSPDEREFYHLAVDALYKSTHDVNQTLAGLATTLGPRINRLFELTKRGELPPREYVLEIVDGSPVSRAERRALLDLHARITQKTAEKTEPRRRPARRRPSIPPQVEDVPGHDLKPDPLTATTPAALVDRMRRYRIWAGDISLRELERRANGAFALSTLSKTLREDKLPPLELLQAFIRACGGSDDDARRWSTAWRQIRMPQPCAEPGRPLSSVTPLPYTRTAG